MKISGKERYMFDAFVRSMTSGKIVDDFIFDDATYHELVCSIDSFDARQAFHDMVEVVRMLGYNDFKSVKLFNERLFLDALNRTAVFVQKCVDTYRVNDVETVIESNEIVEPDWFSELDGMHPSIKIKRR